MKGKVDLIINPSLIPLAEGWWWHVYKGGTGETSIRWIVRNGPADGVFIHRCILCGWETPNSTGLGSHNAAHDREKAAS